MEVGERGLPKNYDDAAASLDAGDGGHATLDARLWRGCHQRWSESDADLTAAPETLDASVSTLPTLSKSVGERTRKAPQRGCGRARRASSPRKFRRAPASPSASRRSRRSGASRAKEALRDDLELARVCGFHLFPVVRVRRSKPTTSPPHCPCHCEFDLTYPAASRLLLALRVSAYGTGRRLLRRPGAHGFDSRSGRRRSAVCHEREARVLRGALAQQVLDGLAMLRLERCPEPGVVAVRYQEFFTRGNVLGEHEAHQWDTQRHEARICLLRGLREVPFNITVVST